VLLLIFNFEYRGLRKKKKGKRKDLTQRYKVTKDTEKRIFNRQGKKAHKRVWSTE